ncbi:MAG: hypothetical protein JWN55_1061 [Frankiales bacterium]|jgi:plastocyanin|nr:hypothetical protein [Frankiales bacterium]
MRATPRWRLLAALVLVTGCGGGTTKASHPTTAPGGSSSSAAGQPITDGGTKDATALSEVAVDAKDYLFSPSSIVARPGQVLTLVVHNVGATKHNVRQDAQHVNADLATGATTRVRLTVPASGRLVFVCEYHAASGMAGSIGPTGTAAATGSPSSGAGYGGYG